MSNNRKPQFCLGAGFLTGITLGSRNLVLGQASGDNYTGSESNNILLMAAGTAAESNVIRIGTQGSGLGQQNTCYVAGVAGVSVSNLNVVTINTSTGQLGSQARGGEGFTSINVQTFTTSGTYTPTASMAFCTIPCLAAGGGGGGSPATGGGYSWGDGGGAGEYAVGTFTAAAVGASQTVTIGTGGTGAAGVDGGTGGDTSVGALITCVGGTGGAANAETAVGASGFSVLEGTGGSGGNYRTPGSPGFYGIAYPGSRCSMEE